MTFIRCSLNLRGVEARVRRYAEFAQRSSLVFNLSCVTVSTIAARWFDSYEKLPPHGLQMDLIVKKIGTRELFHISAPDPEGLKH